MTVTELMYAKTPGGDRIHVVVGGTKKAQLTACGSYVYQLVLVEEPIPLEHLCEWCRAKLGEINR